MFGCYDLASVNLSFRTSPLTSFTSVKTTRLKKRSLLVFSLALLSILGGYLLSAISFVGRAGINLFYTEYKFLKSWWKGALLLFIVWLILFVVQSVLYKRSGRITATIVQVVGLLLAIGGLFFSYLDFRNTISHRWLGERFHLGVYLFWLVWMAISVFILVKEKRSADITP
jgi:hypothetical protein